MQAMNSFLQIVGYVFPFGFAVAAMKSTLKKDANFYNRDTYMCLIVTTGWIILSIFFSFRCINRKK